MKNNNPQANSTTITGGFGSIRPLHSLLTIVLIISVALVVLGLGAAAGHMDYGLYTVMVALFGAGGVIVVRQFFQLNIWLGETAAEFEFLEKRKSVRQFLDASTSSTTPARAMIYGLMHSLRPGRRVESDWHLAVMDAELAKVPSRVRLIGTTLVQLGIFGTALGAMASLSALSTFAATTEITAGPKLFQQLLGPGSAIGGLALAFGSTVLGLGSGMALRALAGALEAISQAYADHVAELVGWFVLPDLWIDEGDAPSEEAA